jgi:hypothetical protein
MCQGTSRKLPLLAQHQIDAAVLCEASLDPPPPTLHDPEVLLWASEGTNPKKSVVVAGLTVGGKIEDSRVGQGRFSVAATLHNGVGVLGVWTCPERSGRYGRELLNTIDAYEEFLAARSCIVAGDFNLIPNGTEEAALKTARDRFEILGYTSAYHHFTNCSFGEEQDPTHYFRRKHDAPFHIDYVFLPERLMSHVISVEVGSFDDWTKGTRGQPGFSDHVPIIVEFSDATFPET